MYALTLSMVIQAQRCAVLEFKARVGISQADVDGISSMFITYFKPRGYTMVERTQIDKVIDEQGFQRSNLTERQMVRIGEILNVSKIVVGDVNIVGGQYNVDVRVINVQTGTIVATGGETFASGTSYRTCMQKLAQSLAAKIAINPVSTTISGNNAGDAKSRTTVETIYGYLKIFPKELGVFQSEPTTVISNINKQAQHGYNNWRIPTEEELSLLRANGYLGSGEYMTKENKRGIVLLVTDGEDYETILQKTEQDGGDTETFSVNGVSFEMVRVDGGTFMMGSDTYFNYEEPIHSESVATFYIGKTEVSQALWEAVMGSNPSKFKGANLPVENVSWNDCIEFIERLNRLTDKNFRLPTEAEWEYAARGGNRSQGYTYSGSNNLQSVGWYKENSDWRTYPVGSKLDNEIGLYDMSGNVWEWTYDLWSDDYSSPRNGGSSGSNRVGRGGSYNMHDVGCRSSARNNYSPTNRRDHLGFRLAL